MAGLSGLILPSQGIDTSGDVGVFTDLPDVPSSYTGFANNILRVNSGETGIEFADETSDLFSQYFLLAGRSGGQVAVGGTDASDTLTLRATANATDGNILFETDPTTERARILSTGETLIGRTTLPFSGDILALERNQNAFTAVRLLNTTAGTASRAIFIGVSDTSGFQLGQTSSLFTPGGGVDANQSYLQASSGAASLNLMTEGSVPILFKTSSLERARIASTGQLLIGKTSPLTTTPLDVEKNQNTDTLFNITNTSTGTSAVSSVAASSASHTIRIGVTGLNASSGVPGISANESFIRSSRTITVQSTGETIFQTNGVERMRITGANRILIGPTVHTLSENQLEVRGDGAGPNRIFCRNDGVGTGTEAGVAAANDGTTYVELIMTGASATEANVAMVRAQAAASELRIVTLGADPINFRTGDVLRGAFNSAGDWALESTTKIGYFGTSPVAQAAALTAKDASVIDATYDAVEQGVLNNVRTRVDEIESRLQAYGLLA